MPQVSKTCRIRAATTTLETAKGGLIGKIVLVPGSVGALATKANTTDTAGTTKQ
jgi:hypothetical protein